MSYKMTLEQVGSRGTIFGETNFGLAFTADFIEERGSRVPRRHRVVNILSYCCQAVHKPTTINGRVVSACHLCGQPVTREYPSFDGEDFDRFDRAVSQGSVEDFDSIIVADSIGNVLENFWSEIAWGGRTRQVLKQARFAGEIEL